VPRTWRHSITQSAARPNRLSKPPARGAVRGRGRCVHRSPCGHKGHGGDVAGERRPRRRRREAACKSPCGPRTLVPHYTSGVTVSHSDGRRSWGASFGTSHHHLPPPPIGQIPHSSNGGRALECQARPGLCTVPTGDESGGEASGHLATASPPDPPIGKISVGLEASVCAGSPSARQGVARGLPAAPRTPGEDALPILEPGLCGSATGQSPIPTRCGFARG
jgi:hypothetical protein